MKIAPTAALAVSLTLFLNACGATPATTSVPVSAPDVTTAAAETTPSTAAVTRDTAAAAMTASVAVTTNAGRSPANTDRSSTTAPPAAATTSAAAPAGSGGPAGFEGDYQKMEQAMLAATSWRQTMVLTDKAGARTEMTTEFVRPDRVHEKMTNHAGVTTEYIIIGADMYRYDGTAWQKAPGGQVGEATLAGLAGAKPGTPEYDQAQQARKDEGLAIAKGGRSTRNGVPCQEWNTTSTTPPTSGVLCIGLRNNLPVESKSSIGDGGTATVTYTDWNTPITINAPI